MSIATSRATVLNVRSLLSAAAVLVAFCALGTARADRLPDSFNDTVRDAVLWTEVESATATGCRVREYAGKLRFESGGVASSASYRFRKRLDWNDGFVVDWKQSSVMSTSSVPTRSGRAGLAMGWGTFDPVAGFADGVNIEVIRTSAYRRLVMTLRQGGQSVSSAYCNIGTAEYGLRMVCSTGFVTSIDVYLNGGVSPVLSLDGVDAIFSNRNTLGISMVLLASNSAGVTLDCRFDDFKAWGDQFDDSDDRLADDADSADDDDDKDGYDDSPDDGDDDDGDGAEPRSATVAKFNAALSAIGASSPLPTLQAEVERSGSLTVVTALQWKASTSQFVEVRANAATGAVVGTRSWTPTAAERSRIQPEIDLLPAVTVLARTAVTSAVVGGATVSEVELESEDGGPVWKVKYLTVAGDESDTEVPAN